MKKNCLLFLMIMLSMSAFAQKQFTIKGTAPDKYNGSLVYLANRGVFSPINTVPVYMDSTFVSNGQFLFIGELPKDTLLIYTIELDKNAGFLVMDTEQMTADYIESNPTGYFRISGSALNDDLNQIFEFPHKLNADMLSLGKKRAESIAKNEWTLEDDEAAKEIEKKSAGLYIELINKVVRQNITNSVGQSVYILYEKLLKKDVIAEIEPKISKDVKEKISAFRKSMEDMMESYMQSQPDKGQLNIGEKYADFEGEMLSGEKLKLSSVIESKKLTLLDFWASWCIPCIQEMPEITNLYDVYKDKGLVIIGISLDKSRDKWRNMVESTGMHWLQFIDSNLSNPIADMYGVYAIPYTVLIDEDGQIVATNLRGEQLREKIHVLLSE